MVQIEIKDALVDTIRLALGPDEMIFVVPTVGMGTAFEGRDVIERPIILRALQFALKHELRSTHLHIALLVEPRCNPILLALLHHSGDGLRVIFDALQVLPMRVESVFR